MKNSRYDFLAHGHGKTAPWVDLVNSEEWDTLGRLTDHLQGPAWTPYFLRQWQFPPSPRKSLPLAQLRLLRATLRKSCEALGRGKPVPHPALQVLNAALNVTGKHQMFQRQNGLQLEFVAAKSGWDWTLAEIVRSFAKTAINGESERIKICRNEKCHWVFYDQTKGKTRCWCSDKSCGNRERVRRARAREKK